MNPPAHEPSGVSCALGLAELFDDWNQACKWLVTREFTADLANTPGLESLEGIFEEAFLEEDDLEEDRSKEEVADAEPEYDAETETGVTTDRATPLG